MATYPTTFRNYITRTLTFVLTRVQKCPHLLPDDVRKQALHALSYGLDLEDAWELVCNLLLTMAPKMEQAGFRGEWIPYLERLVEDANKHQDWRTTGEVKRQIGLIYRLLSDYALSTAWLELSLQDFSKVHDTIGQARTLNELALLQHWFNKYSEATQNVEHALELLDPEDPERGMSYRILGMIAHEQRRLQEAESYHRTALAIFERVGEPRKIAWGLQNLATSLREQGKTDKAIPYYLQSAKILQAEGDRHHWAVIWHNLGVAYALQGDLASALNHYREVEPIFRQLADKLRYARLCIDLGLGTLQNQRHDESQRAFTQAIALFTELDDKRWRLYAMDGLAMVYLAKQEAEIARQLLNQALDEVAQNSDIIDYANVLQTLSDHLAEAKMQIATASTMQVAICA